MVATEYEREIRGLKVMAKVMVVEDEDVLLEMIAALIEELGHDPITATNGYEALHTLQAGADTPQLILSDVMMPRVNGVELARAVKTDPHFSQVPVILMSAAGRPPEDHVADYFVHKPFDLDMIANLIEHYLHH